MMREPPWLDQCFHKKRSSLTLSVCEDMVRRWMSALQNSKESGSEPGWFREWQMFKGDWLGWEYWLIECKISAKGLTHAWPLVSCILHHLLIGCQWWCWWCQGLQLSCPWSIPSFSKSVMGWTQTPLVQTENETRLDSRRHTERNEGHNCLWGYAQRILLVSVSWGCYNKLPQT